LSDGTALHDLLGADFTLLSLRNELVPREFVAKFTRTGVPLECVALDDASLEKFYEAKFILVRPDVHIAWRGERLPDPDTLRSHVIGDTLKSEEGSTNLRTSISH